MFRDGADPLSLLPRQPRIGNAGTRGVTLDEMRKRIRLLDAVESMSGSELELEDSDYDVLKPTYNSFPFGIVHRDLVAIGKAIDGAS